MLVKNESKSIKKRKIKEVEWGSKENEKIKWLVKLKNNRCAKRGSKANKKYELCNRGKQRNQENWEIITRKNQLS